MFVRGKRADTLSHLVTLYTVQARVALSGWGKQPTVLHLGTPPIVFTEQGTSHIGADVCFVFKSTSFPSFSTKSMNQR